MGILKGIIAVVKSGYWSGGKARKTEGKAPRNHNARSLARTAKTQKHKKHRWASQKHSRSLAGLSCGTTLTRPCR